MPRSRDLLARFRPTGTPGAAAGRGVPADRSAELAAELEPVLGLLDDTLEECRRMRAAAGQEAARRRRLGRERAAALEAEARTTAEAERAEAATEVSRRVAGDVAAVLAEAQLQADALRSVATERLPGYADRAVRAVRAALEEEP